MPMWSYWEGSPTAFSQSVPFPITSQPVLAQDVSEPVKVLADRTQFLSASKSNLIGINRFSGSNYFSGSTTIGGVDFDISSTNVQFDSSTNVEVSGSWYFTVAPETNGIVLDSSSNITYASGRSTTKLLSLISGQPLNLPNAFTLTNNGTVAAASTGEIWLVPLNLPHGCTITKIRCGVITSGTPNIGNEPRLGLVRTNPNLSTGGWAVLTTLEDITGPSTATTTRIDSGTISHTIDNDSYTYIVQLTAANAGTTTLFSWLEVTFTDSVLTNK